MRAARGDGHVVHGMGLNERESDPPSSLTLDLVVTLINVC